MNKLIKILSVLTGLLMTNLQADEFDKFLKPLFASKCVDCHGKKKTKGKVDLYKINNEAQLLAHPKMIKEMIEAIDANDMPPEDEPQLSQANRTKLLISLKSMLKKAASTTVTKKQPLNRLNRLQYNHSTVSYTHLTLPTKA